jgi:hypothetical protein
MKRMIGITAVVALLAASAGYGQDKAALIEKLKSKDKDESDNAREDLLKLGAAAVQPLRDAAAKSDDAGFKKSAASIADRLETRQAAAGLAKSWGDRWYSVFIQTLHVGWAHFKAEEKDGKVVVAVELRVQQNKDTVFEIRATMTCEPNEYLSLSDVALDIASPDNSVSATARVKDGRLVVKAGGETKAVKLQGNTVVDLAVFPLVTILPRTDAYEVEVLQFIKPKLPEAGLLKFEKEESIEFGGKKVKTRRFMLSTGDSKDRFYYVDAAGQLLRVHLVSGDEKDVEMMLTDEKRAKDIDTKD